MNKYKLQNSFQIYLNFLNFGFGAYVVFSMKTWSMVKIKRPMPRDCIIVRFLPGRLYSTILPKTLEGPTFFFESLLDDFGDHTTNLSPSPCLFHKQTNEMRIFISHSLIIFYLDPLCFSPYLIHHYHHLCFCFSFCF